MQRAQHTSTKLAKPVKRRQIITLTPLIDVVFILIVFFMLTSSFLEWRSISVDTSSSEQASASDEQPLVIKVQQQKILLNNAPIELSELTAKLQNRQPTNQAVNLQPIADTSTQQLVKVLDVLNNAGIKPLKLIEDPEWTQSPSAQHLGELHALP